jgi:hypothetical protein
VRSSLDYSATHVGGSARFPGRCDRGRFGHTPTDPATVVNARHRCLFALRARLLFVTGTSIGDLGCLVHHTCRASEGRMVGGPCPSHYRVLLINRAYPSRQRKGVPLRGATPRLRAVRHRDRVPPSADASLWRAHRTAHWHHDGEGSSPARERPSPT